MNFTTTDGFREIYPAWDEWFMDIAVTLLNVVNELFQLN